MMTDDLVDRLRERCVDYDGSQMRDAEEPRGLVTCGELREAANVITALEGALRLIRNHWAGHAEQCALVTSEYSAKCDCDWPKVAKECDAALSLLRGDGK